MPGIVCTIAPSAEPVSLDEARLHCRVDGTDEDTLLSALITAARVQAEAETGRILAPSTWTISYAGGVQGELPLPLVPVTAVTAVTVDGDAVDASLYTFTSSGLVLGEWPVQARLVLDDAFPQGPTAVTVTAGYSDDAFPAPIKQWMLVRISTLFDQREGYVAGAVSMLGRTFVDCLLDPYRLSGGH